MYECLFSLFNFNLFLRCHGFSHSDNVLLLVDNKDNYSSFDLPNDSLTGVHDSITLGNDSSQVMLLATCLF
jgi:hypothetical protein